jgi:aspartyl-tRNA(Asn)/glutamyl-tRNA(Gln) amidotransferase subunit B
MADYQTVIGMEIHVELKTASKMFCGCVNDPFHAPAPNTQTCPVCLGLPGALPVATRKAVEQTIRLGLALGCSINEFSKFDRKHYFYPDLPKGYQISQYDLPFCHDGTIRTSQSNVRIRRVHLEEDTGKLIHDTVNGERVTLVDFNRSGVPLMEIVTEPDITSASQAKEYCKNVRQLVRYLGIAECDMEQGGMRLEANISVRRPGETGVPDYKVELKNINSFRFLERGIVYEVARQTELLKNNETPAQETRGYNPEKDQTFIQRTKESAEDYRYFPEPDLPPMRFSPAEITAFRNALPELPDAVMSRWEQAYGIKPDTAELLFDISGETSLRDRIVWFDGFFKDLKQDQKMPHLPIGTSINRMLNKRVGEPFWFTVTGAADTMRALRDSIVVDDVPDEAIAAAVSRVIVESPDAVRDYRAGKTQVMNFLVGQTAKILGKRVAMDRVKTAIEREFGKA